MSSQFKYHFSFLRGSKTYRAAGYVKFEFVPTARPFYLIAKSSCCPRCNHNTDLENVSAQTGLSWLCWGCGLHTVLWLKQDVFGTEYWILEVKESLSRHIEDQEQQEKTKRECRDMHSAYREEIIKIVTAQAN